MDVYILDSLYRRNAVVDKFESLIWTERFSAYGDFELTLQSTFDNRNRFKNGTILGLNESYRAMTVETVEDAVDNEGRSILKLKGRSLEAILDSRLARGTMGDLTTTPKWVLTGTPYQIAFQMFHDICISGVLDVGDKIPLIHEGSLFPADTNPFPTDVITYEVDPKTLYAAVKELCELYHMGFRMCRNLDNSELWFDIYVGSDRTTHQTSLEAVVFSANLDNLRNTTELTTTATYKNVAYVITPVGSQIVYAQDIDPAISGFDRKVLMVKADDIKDTDPSVATAKMIQKANQELGKNRKYSAFDGEISQYSQYKYGTDYNLGDLVELVNNSGATSTMQVTEHIFVSDKEGDRSYPTLTINQFVTPGSWMSRPIQQEWMDVPLTEQWGNI